MYLRTITLNTFIALFLIACGGGGGGGTSSTPAPAPVLDPAAIAQAEAEALAAEEEAAARAAAQAAAEQAAADAAADAAVAQAALDAAIAAQAAAQAEADARTAEAEAATRAAQALQAAQAAQAALDAAIAAEAAAAAAQASQAAAELQAAQDAAAAAQAEAEAAAAAQEAAAAEAAAAEEAAAQAAEEEAAAQAAAEEAAEREALAVLSMSGEVVYSQPLPDGNTFACATCHALTETATDEFQLPGHQLSDALRRPSFKNGLFPDFLNAANSCRDEWMVARSGRWTDESEEYRALVQFLTEQDTGTGEAESIEYIIVSDEDALNEVSAVGDAIAGQEMFNRSCIVCHGEDAAGTERGFPLNVRDREPEFIARKVRLSGRTNSNVYPGLIGGVMPFWAADRLSDEELGDLIAYLNSLTAEEAEEEEEQEEAPAPVVGASGCGNDHPKVGQVATLSTFAHDVSGTVTIIDNCTLRVENFNFDGQGINVDWYAGVEEQRSNGRTRINYDLDISLGDLPLGFRRRDANFNLPLPAGITLDDFDGISVWCIPVRTSFGDGAFQ